MYHDVGLALRQTPDGLGFPRGEIGQIRAVTPETAEQGRDIGPRGKPTFGAPSLPEPFD